VGATSPDEGVTRTLASAPADTLRLANACRKKGCECLLWRADLTSAADQTEKTNSEREFYTRREHIDNIY